MLCLFRQNGTHHGNEKKPDLLLLSLVLACALCVGMLARSHAPTSPKPSDTNHRTDVLSRSCHGPVILSHPNDLTVCTGQSVTLSATAAGTLPMTFQWFHDNHPVPGAVSAQYQIPSVSSSHAGSWRCEVSNCGGVTTGAPFQLSTNTGANGHLEVHTSALFSGPPGTQITVPVSIGDLTGLSIEAGSLTLNYDPAFLIFQNMDTSSSHAPNWLWAHNDTGTAVNVSGAGTTSLPSQGGLLFNLVFQIHPTAPVNLSSQLTFSNLLFNEDDFCITASAAQIVPCQEGGAGNLGMSIEGEPAGVPGGVASIPVVIENLGAHQLYSTTFTVLCDINSLTLNGLDQIGALGESWTWQASQTNHGVVVSGAGAQPLSGDGVLIQLRLEVAEHVAEDACLDLDFSGVHFNESQYCVSTTPGRVCACLKGDVTGNGEISSFDAAHILQFLVGLQPEPSLCAADTTCDGSVSAQDASDILKWVTGLIGEFCAEPDPIRATTLTAVSVPDTLVQPKAQFSIPLLVNDITNAAVTAYTLAVQYDPQHLRLDQVSVENTLQNQTDWLLAYHQPQPGRLLVSGAGTHALTGAGPLIFLEGRATDKPGRSELILEFVEFNEHFPAVQLPEEPARVSVPGIMITPVSQALGLCDPALEAISMCCDQVMTPEWFNRETGQWLGSGPSLVLPSPLQETLVVEARLATSSGDYLDRSHVLVPHHPDFLDLNQDGCNTADDLNALVEGWSNSVGDLNGDGFVNILDFLYINIHCGCPQQP